MQNNFQIRYVRNAEVDKLKWDKCITEANNSRVYALSSYLDCMCTNWDALVVNDYELVMPLPWRKKFGVSYLYQPAFTQQLGVFSREKISTKIVDLFLKNIPAKFLYWDIALNAGNTTTHPFRPAKNYLLPLDSSYETLAENYNRNARRNIKKAIDANISIVDDSIFSDTIKLHRTRFHDSIGASEDDYKKLDKLLTMLQQNNAIYSTCAVDETGSIIASSTYLLHNNRVIFLINGNLQKSLETGATHLLKDHVIRKFSGGNWVMDFEGSDFLEFAKFYEQFGAKEIEYYPLIIQNKLPWPIKYLKRNSPAL